ncbi:MAG: hypothetical protein KBS57_00100, partial [Alistipes sp.]|nr:hypothetical protein [Candidatus Minthomonas equi]
MRRILISGLTAVLLSAMTAYAASDVSFVEPADPNPGDQTAWASLTGPRVGWGSIDVRYSRSQVATMEKKVSLTAWRGERVSAQAVVSTPVNLSCVKVSASELKCGRDIIPSENVKTWFVRYTIAGRPGEKETFLVPDRLDAACQMAVAANGTRPVWVEVK